MSFSKKISTAVLFFIATTLSAASSAGEAKNYLIYLNPFAVQDFDQKLGKKNNSTPEFLKNMKMDERFNYVNKNINSIKYSPSVEGVKEILISTYGLRNIGKTADLTPAFYAKLTDEELGELKSSEYISYIDEVKENEKGGVLSYSDLNVAGEIIPWGKQAVIADDGITTSNKFYIVDTTYENTYLSNEINLIYSDNRGLNVNNIGNHPAAILSLVGGSSNFQKIRGINPGQPIVHAGAYMDQGNIAQAIKLLAEKSELWGDFSTLNLSMNWTTLPNYYDHNKDIGKAIRIASSRLLVTQSAGNLDQDACKNSFNYGSGYQDNDGIIVVGGTDNVGARYPATPNPLPFATEPRSNYGKCIEAWAPGNLMTTTIKDGSLVTATGTSFAAPLVAAIAGRYGDHTTRPIERERYVKDNLWTSGNYDFNGLGNSLIKQVRYTNPAFQSFPKLIPINGVYSKTNTVNLNSLTDGNFYDPSYFWSAGANWGSIVVDLGSVKSVNGVRLHMRSSANNGQIDFAVHGSNSMNSSGPGSPSTPTNPIAYKTVYDQFDMVPYYISISGNYRYLMIEANNYDSWLAYSEIEVYGN